MYHGFINFKDWGAAGVIVLLAPERRVKTPKPRDLNGPGVASPAGPHTGPTTALRLRGYGKDIGKGRNRREAPVHG